MKLRHSIGAVILLAALGGCEGYKARPFTSFSYGVAEGFGVNDASTRFEVNEYPGWSMNVGVSLEPPQVWNATQFERMMAAMRDQPDPQPIIIDHKDEKSPDPDTIGAVGDAVKKVSETDLVTKAIIAVVVLFLFVFVMGALVLLWKLGPIWLKKGKKDAQDRT